MSTGQILTVSDPPVPETTTATTNISGGLNVPTTIAGSSSTVPSTLRDGGSIAPTTMAGSGSTVPSTLCDGSLAIPTMAVGSSSTVLMSTLSDGCSTIPTTLVGSSLTVPSTVSASGSTVPIVTAGSGSTVPSTITDGGLTFPTTISSGSTVPSTIIGSGSTFPTMIAGSSLSTSRLIYQIPPVSTMMYVPNVPPEASSNITINNIADPSALDSSDDMTLQEVENALDGLGEFEELYLLEDPSTLVEGNDQNLSSTSPASSFVNSATSANKITTDDKTGNLIFSLILPCICVQFKTHITELHYTIAAVQNTIISILQNQQALSQKLTELEVTINGNGVLLPLCKLVFMCR